MDPELAEHSFDTHTVFRAGGDGVQSHVGASFHAGESVEEA